MDFCLLKDVSEDVYEKVKHITSISLALKTFFKDKHYGKGILSFTIGIICVAPKFEFASKERKKYIKSKQTLEYDIKLDHAKFKTANEKEIKEIISEGIMNSLYIISEFKISDFDIERFKKDLEVFFLEKI